VTVFSCQKMSDKQPEHQNAILTRSALPTREGRAAKPLQNFGYVSEYTSNVPKQPANARKNQSRSSPHKPPTPPHAVNLSQSTTQDRRTPPAYPFLSDLHVKEQNQTIQRFIPSRIKYRGFSHQSQPRPRMLSRRPQHRKKFLRHASVRRYLGPRRTRVNSMTAGFYIRGQSDIAAMP
jgi:hypothetical protein